MQSIFDYEAHIWDQGPVYRAWNTRVRHCIGAFRGIKPGKVMELGCGNGVYLRTLRRLWPDMRVYGIDVSRASLRLARTYGQDIPYVCGDIDHLPVARAAVNTILIFDVLEHLRDLPHTLRTIRDVLAPGGVLHVSVPCEGEPLTLHWMMWTLHIHEDVKVHRSGHVQRLTKNDMLGMLSRAGFRVTAVAHSMHWLGQTKDLLEYASWQGLCGTRLGRVLSSAIWRLLWILAGIESWLLSWLQPLSINLHVTCVKID